MSAAVAAVSATLEAVLAAASAVLAAASVAVAAAVDPGKLCGPAGWLVASLKTGSLRGSTVRVCMCVSVCVCEPIPALSD